MLEVVLQKARERHGEGTRGVAEGAGPPGGGFEARYRGFHRASAFGEVLRLDGNVSWVGAVRAHASLDSSKDSKTT